MNLKNKKILCTGGSGFLGHEIIKKLLDIGCQVRIVARNEGKLVATKEKYPAIEIIIGDISDPYICEKACQGIDGIIHAAALKHVGLAEVNVREAIKSNIPLTLLEVTRKLKPEFFIATSTDKAASRKGVYGCTKYLMERLVAEYEQMNPDTRYRIVRYGNVIYSTGSVLVKWKEKLENNEKIVITDPDATRFFWTVEQAVDLIFECLEKATDSSPYVTQMKSIRMGDLLNAMMRKYRQVPVETIGLQIAENKHEIIVEGGISSEQAEKYTEEEIMAMV